MLYFELCSEDLYGISILCTKIDSVVLFPKAVENFHFEKTILTLQGSFNFNLVNAVLQRIRNHKNKEI